MSEEGTGLTLRRLVADPGPLLKIVGQMFPGGNEDGMRSNFCMTAIYADVLDIVRQSSPFADPVIQNHQIGDGSHAALRRFVFSTLQKIDQLDSCAWQDPSRFPKVALYLFDAVVQELLRSAVNAVHERYLQEVQSLVDARFLRLLSDRPWLSDERLRPRVTLEPVASTDVPGLAEIVGGEDFASMMSSLFQRSHMDSDGRG